MRKLIGAAELAGAGVLLAATFSMVESVLWLPAFALAIRGARHLRWA